MSGADPKRKIAEGAAALAASPSDLGEWFDLGAALAAAGKRDEAVTALAELGKVASELGQVALAVACARWLDGNRGKDEAKSLVAQIANTHCAGSERIDRSSRPRPPAPPPAQESVAEAPKTKSLKDAVAAAEKAVEAAIVAAGERAGDKLPPTPLLSVLDAKEIEQFIGVTRLSRHKQGRVVVDLGQPASALFWLARGSVDVTREGEALGELRSGAFFGEIALLAGTTRTATVTCADECWMLEIPAAAVEELAGKAPNLAVVLAEYARSRLLSNVMRTSELFQRIDESDRKLLLGRFKSRIVRAGERIVAKDEDNEQLHVIVSGHCEVRDDGEVVATLLVGDGFGESSLLRRTPAAADVVAVDNTVTLSLSRHDFDDIALKHPELLAEVYKMLVERERENKAIHHDATDLII